LLSTLGAERESVPTNVFEVVGIRNSTGSPIFSDFQSELSRVARFPTAGQGIQRPMVRGCKLQKLEEIAHDHKMPRRVEKANGKLEKGEKILIK